MDVSDNDIPPATTSSKRRIPPEELEQRKMAGLQEIFKFYARQHIKNNLDFEKL